MDNEKIPINVKPPWKVSKGHNPRKNSAGAMKDRRTKRQRTRQTQKKKAIEEDE